MGFAEIPIFPEVLAEPACCQGNGFAKKRNIGKGVMEVTGAMPDRRRRSVLRLRPKGKRPLADVHVGAGLAR
jgi:hypothetical protein